MRVVIFISCTFLNTYFLELPLIYLMFFTYCFGIFLHSFRQNGLGFEPEILQGGLHWVDSCY